jgi:hypothetical protein
VEERTHTKKGITKKMPRCSIGRIEIKGYVKLVEHQFEKHMEYDDMNEAPLGNVHN